MTCTFGWESDYHWNRIGVAVKLVIVTEEERESGCFCYHSVLAQKGCEDFDKRACCQSRGRRSGSEFAEVEAWMMVKGHQVGGREDGVATVSVVAVVVAAAVESRP